MLEAEPRSQRPALICDGLEVGRAELEMRLYRVAGALARLGLEPGDRVAVLAPLGVRSVEAFLGEAFAMESGARYTHLLGNELDTVGMSRYWGPEHTDVNVGVFEAFLGGVYYFAGQ